MKQLTIALMAMVLMFVPVGPGKKWCEGRILRACFFDREPSASTQPLHWWTCPGNKQCDGQYPLPRPEHP